MTSGFIEVKPINSSYKIMINVDQIIFVRKGRSEIHDSQIVKEWCEIKTTDGNKYEPIIDVEETYEEVRKLIDNAINRISEQKCINCKHRPIDAGPYLTPKTPVKEYADLGLDEPEPIDWDYTCPYVCGDSWHNRMPKDDDFCSKFEKKEEER